MTRLARGGPRCTLRCWGENQAPSSAGGCLKWILPLPLWDKMLPESAGRAERRWFSRRAIRKIISFTRTVKSLATKWVSFFVFCFLLATSSPRAERKGAATIVPSIFCLLPYTLHLRQFCCSCLHPHPVPACILDSWWGTNPLFRPHPFPS